MAGATILPVEGVTTYTESGEAIRQAVNQWIRTSGAYDAVIDFDAAVRDPANPKRLRAAFDPGDHVHPNDAGTKPWPRPSTYRSSVAELQEAR